MDISQPEGIVTLASAHSVAETLTRLQAAIQAKGLKLFAHIDHSGEAARVGLTMPPTHVLIYGNPRGGTPVMLAAPLIALELPLKLLIWQDAAGQAHVSYTSGAYLARRYALPPDLAGNLTGFEGVVAEVLRA